MAYNSTLPTPKIEGALLASLKTKKIEYNITQDKSSNYASLAEAIAAVDDDEYKVKGIVLTFYTGTDWVSKRYNGEDASGFADEGNWIDVGGAAGGTQYLDLSIFSGESGTLSEEDYQKVVKAYEDKVNMLLVEFESTNLICVGNILYSGSNYIIICLYSIGYSANIRTNNIQITLSSNRSYTKTEHSITLFSSGLGTNALTDNGRYAEFAKPTKVESGGSGTVTKELQPNVLYKFGECASLTITLAESDNSADEYMFTFDSGSTPTSISLPDTVIKDEDDVIEANKHYEVSVRDNYLSLKYWNKA